MAGRADRYDRYQRAAEIPLLVLALLMIPLLTVPLVVELSPGAERALLVVDVVVWVTFAGDYVTGLYLAPSRRTSSASSG